MKLEVLTGASQGRIAMLQSIDRYMADITDADIADPNHEVHTPAMKAWLSQYNGYGGVKDVAREDMPQPSGVLHEFFTPMSVCAAMWRSAITAMNRYDLEDGLKVLEPSAGTGRLLYLPDSLKQTQTIHGVDTPAMELHAFESNPTSAKILRILYPDLVYEGADFESIFMQAPVRRGMPSKRSRKDKPSRLHGQFDIVIGNPPYGTTWNTKYTDEHRHIGAPAYEMYFIDRCLDLLKPGGVLVFLQQYSMLQVPSENAKWERHRKKLNEKCRLFDAWRLPDTTFDDSTYPPDLIVLKKAEPGEYDGMERITGGDIHYERYPEKVLGTQEDVDQFMRPITVHPTKGKAPETSISGISVILTATERAFTGSELAVCLHEPPAWAYPLRGKPGSEKYEADKHILEGWNKQDWMQMQKPEITPPQSPEPMERDIERSQEGKEPLRYEDDPKRWLQLEIQKFSKRRNKEPYTIGKLVASLPKKVMMLLQNEFEITGAFIPDKYWDDLSMDEKSRMHEVLKNNGPTMASKDKLGNQYVAGYFGTQYGDYLSSILQIDVWDGKSSLRCHVNNAYSVYLLEDYFKQIESASELSRDTILMWAAPTTTTTIQELMNHLVDKSAAEQEPEEFHSDTRTGYDVNALRPVTAYKTTIESIAQNTQINTPKDWSFASVYEVVRNVQMKDRIIGTIIPFEQHRVMIEQHKLKDYERQAFYDKMLDDLWETLITIPNYRGQDGMGDQAIAYLHYFGPSQDWYVTELYWDGYQWIGFGWVDLGPGFYPELGQFPIDDLVSNAQINLDLHWTPKTLAEIKGVEAEPEPDKGKAKAKAMLKLAAAALALKAEAMKLKGGSIGLGGHEIGDELVFRAYDDGHDLELAITKGGKRRMYHVVLSDDSDILRVESTNDPDEAREIMSKFVQYVRDAMGEHFGRSIDLMEPSTVGSLMQDPPPFELQVLKGDELAAPRKRKQAEEKPVKVELVPFDEAVSSLNPDMTDEEIQVYAWYINTKQDIPVELMGDQYDDWRLMGVAQNAYNDSLAAFNERFMLANPPLQKWLQNGLLCYYRGVYLPEAIYYSGDIYRRIAIAKQDKQEGRIDPAILDRQILRLDKEVKPEPLSLQEPDPDKRLWVNPISDLAKEFMIYETLTADQYEDGITLQNLFRRWLEGLTASDYEIANVDAYKIKNFLLDGATRVNRYVTVSQKKDPEKYKQQKGYLLSSVRSEGERLFQVFLQEELTVADKEKLSYLYNSTYNNYAKPDYDKIPVVTQYNRYFKDKTLEIRSAQREGVAHLIGHGNSICAYDVGVGKTLTSILAAGNAMTTGMAKRPVFVVPTKVYPKWVKEIKMILPHIKLNEWGNLGVDVLDKLLDEEGDIIDPILDGSITIMTYEGWVKVGFSDDTEKALANEYDTILNQVDNQEMTDAFRDSVRKSAEAAKERSTQVSDGLSARMREKQWQRVNKGMTIGLKEQVFSMSELMFDFLVVDEAHFFKNSIKSVRYDKDDSSEGMKYQFGSGGSPSQRGMHMLLMSLYFNRFAGNKNIMLLTATPFTNSALEVYTMTALVGYSILKRNRLLNVADFFKNYAEESFDRILTSTNQLAYKSIIKSFKNKRSLQNLLAATINYKSGEDAGIERPDKHVLPEPLGPNARIGTELEMGDIQKENSAFIEAFALSVQVQDEMKSGRTMPATVFGGKSGESPELVVSSLAAQLNLDDEEDESMGEADVLGGHFSAVGTLGASDKGVRTLRAVMYSQANALSPYLFDTEGLPEPTPISVVETSPKLKYTCECIRSVKKHHESKGTPVSGQVIYCRVGIVLFGYLAQYLIDEVGYAPDEVAIIGGTSKHHKYIAGITQARIAKNNNQIEQVKDDFLANKVKIIIGTSKIREGVDLQNHGSVLYNLLLDWNPTDMTQVEGRIWRFGNKFANVRIVTPLLEDSVDVFMFQKIGEKMARLNDLWSATGENVFDVTDNINPDELKYGLITDPNRLATVMWDDKMQDLQLKLDVATGERDQMAKFQEQFFVYQQEYSHLQDYILTQEPDAIIKSSTDIKRKINTIQKRLEKAAPEGLSPWERAQQGYKLPWEIEQSLNRLKSVIKPVEKFEKNTLIPNGLSLTSNLSELAVKLRQEVEGYEAEKATMESSEYKNALVVKVMMEQEKHLKNRKTLQERVTQFGSLNHYLDQMMTYRVSSTETAKPKEVQETTTTNTKKRDKTDLARLKLAAAALALRAEALKLKSLTA